MNTVGGPISSMLTICHRHWHTTVVSLCSLCYHQYLPTRALFGFQSLPLCFVTCILLTPPSKCHHSLSTRLLKGHSLLESILNLHAHVGIE